MNRVIRLKKGCLHFKLDKEKKRRKKESLRFFWTGTLISSLEPLSPEPEQEDTQLNTQLCALQNASIFYVANETCIRNICSPKTCYFPFLLK